MLFTEISNKVPHTKPTKHTHKFRKPNDSPQHELAKLVLHRKVCTIVAFLRELVVWRHNLICLVTSLGSLVLLVFRLAWHADRWCELFKGAAPAGKRVGLQSAISEP